MKIKEDGVIAALTRGDATTKLSAIFMGVGIASHKQIVKGVTIFLLEIAYIAFMIIKGFSCLADLPGLGDSVQEKVWNEALGVYEYSQGDNSVLILLYGVAVLVVTVGFILLWMFQLSYSYQLECKQKAGKPIMNFKEEMTSLKHQNVHITLMSLPMIGIILFNIVPLIFMMSMAFTSYSKENDKLVLFDWVGLDNFARVLNFNGNIGKQFWHVLAWTIVWAFVATFLNYIMGMILALLINRRDTRIKGFWRFCFILSIAVPQFVSLLIMHVMLQPQGAVNNILQNLGITSGALPFWTDATWARITIIVINLWVGIPYTMLQVTGILQNIPADLYEAAKVDGAGPVVTFLKITLPYTLFVTTPYLITSFTGNINNFNVIYLLSGGGPTYVGDTAGQTDLLITWLYKLTVDQNYYNIGAVIGIFTFIVLSVVALVTYRNSGSYKNEEEFM
ncbi:MAG: sugar ABC transporter permease [Lachnospiraceae bacterium]|nr:sugar ABC transporter permease [Lachnospiraceae bacterium]